VTVQQNPNTQFNPNPGQPAYNPTLSGFDPNYKKPKPVFDPEVDGRGLDDVDALRAAVMNNVRDAVSAKFPIENQKHLLRLSNVAYDSEEPISLRDQKRAILSRRSLSRKLNGTWELVDKATGEVVDSRKATVARVPYMTQRGTFIYNGKEYAVANQMRLQDGVYARAKGDGTYESHFNLMSGTGRAFRVGMDPATGSFNLNIGQANMPMYPLFRALGVGDDELRKAWGDDIYDQNKKHDDGSAVSRLYERFSGEKTDAGEAAERLREYVAKMKVKAAIARRSLGKYGEFEEDEDGNSTVTPATLVAATKKLIGMSRGEDEADDRDALSNQTIMGPEDLFAERIRRDSNGELRKMLWKATNKGKLPSNIGAAMTTQLESVLLNSGLGSPLEEINPIEAVDQLNRVTRMGQGGIASVDSVPVEARGVQPSYAGFIDPFRTTECYAADVEVLCEKEWKRWEDVVPADRLAAWKPGAEIVYEVPSRIVSYDYDGVMYCSRSPLASWSVTPDHRMYVVAENGNCFFDLARDCYGSPFYVLRYDGYPMRVEADDQEKRRYSGKVYCATVSTGLLVVRGPGRTGPGFVCGNSEKVGVDVRFAAGLRKGRDGRLYRKMLDAKTGEPRWVSPDDMSGGVVAFPGELERGDEYVVGVGPEGIDYFPREEVSYQIAKADDLHDVGVNLIPMANATQGNRLMVAGKMLNQAMSLTNREAPRVRTRFGDSGSYESEIGRKLGPVRADVSGVVEAVTPDSIIVRGADGKAHEKEMYNNFPLNRKSYFYSVPQVAPGDRVEPGQLLASSNYTNDKGDVALGTHLRTAFIPYKGLGYEDAYVISESAAKRMSHESMYTSDFDPEDGELGYNKYIAMFPEKYKKDQLANMDRQGVVKPGSILRKGDPMILAVGDPPRRGDGQVAGLHRVVRDGKVDKTVAWEHDYDGEVTDAYVDDDGSVKVAVKATVPFQEGDKLSGMYGDKGVVSKIIPDSLMPTDPDGNPYELLQNPLTVPTRKNPAQLYAMVLAKLARLKGTDYVLDKYMEGGLGDFVRKELKSMGLDEDGKEEAYDPETGRKNRVLAGDKYVMALHHTAESKAGARDAGGQGSEARYTAEGLPARGGKEGAKSMANMGMNALISHNAYETLNDMKAYRASRNDDFWRSFMLGYPPPSPKVPEIYKKFEAHLIGAGVNLRKKGDYTHLTAMTDKDVDDIAGDRVVNNSSSLDENLQPIPGGLFDRGLLGGVGGQRWGKIELPEPMPNPIMEDGIKTLLNLTGQQYDDIIAGNEKLHGLVGGKAIKAALSRINLDDAIAAARTEIATGRKTGRDKAVKRLRLLSKAKEHDIHPENWVISKLPVIPPAMRPISQMANGTALISDPNSLYADLMNNADAYKDARKALGDDGVAMERKAVYDSLKAAVGLGDPVHPKLREKGVAGLLRHVFGKGSPKFGMYQRRVVGMNLDLAGRGTVVPNPELDLDHLGLPEDTAWSMYGKFVARNLIRNGMDATRALKEVEDRTDRAKDMLVREMDNRPLTYTRAPAMHRYSVMGAKPILVSGKAIQVSPLITGPMTMDFDGDKQQNYIIVAVSLDIAGNRDRLSYVDSTFIKERRMAGFRNLGVPALNGHEVIYCDLADFPHGELVGSRDDAEFYAVPAGTKVLAIGPGRALQWCDVAQWSVHHNKELEVVTLSGGGQVFTDNDPRAIMGVSEIDGELARYTPADALAKKVMVPVVRNADVSEGALIKVDGPDKEYGKTAIPMLAEVPLCYESGYAIGVMCGDGWVSSVKGVDSRMHVAGVDSDVFDAFEDALPVFFEERVPAVNQKDIPVFAQRWGATSKISVQTVQLSGWMRDQVGTGAKNKHLPSYFLAASRPFRVGLLCGLLDTDGTVTVSNAKKAPQIMVSYSTSSERLAREVRLLCRSLGIHAKITPYVNNHGRAGLIVGLSSIDVWEQNIFSGMRCSRKLNRISGLAAPSSTAPSRATQDKVPFPEAVRELVREWVRQEGGNKKKEVWVAELGEVAGVAMFKKLAANRALAYPRSFGISRISARKLIADGFVIKDDSAYNNWAAWVNDDAVRWEAVELVDKTGMYDDGYDLSVPGAENFMSVDGIILSNTASLHVPVGDAAIKEINEKLLPSRHLRDVQNFDVHYTPSQEYVLGLYQATKRKLKAGKKAEPKYFADVASARKAYRRGEVAKDDEVIIGGKD
jgi:DNA-directed RNA polymerase beta subunit